MCVIVYDLKVKTPFIGRPYRLSNSFMVLTGSASFDKDKRTHVPQVRRRATLRKSLWSQDLISTKNKTFEGTAKTQSPPFAI